jgi:hypothetical protein
VFEEVHVHDGVEDEGFGGLDGRFVGLRCLMQRTNFLKERWLSNPRIIKHDHLPIINLLVTPTPQLHYALFDFYQLFLYI